MTHILLLLQDGQPDQRLSSEHGFGGDRERASEAGKQGGSTQPDEVSPMFDS